ncbi:MAG: acyl-CoA dehydrogenase family protein [Myxococcota bacterium]
MNLDLSETQELLRTTVRGFLERELPFERIRELERPEAEGRHDEVLWKELGRQGWLGLGLSEARGGAEASLVDVGLLVEELARCAAIVPALEALLVARVLDRHAAAAVADEWVARILAGEAVVVPALFESGRTDRAPAVEVDSDGRIRGEKAFVDYARSAGHHLVSARGSDGVGLYLADARAAGVTPEALRSIGRTPLAAVRYEGVPAQHVAGADALDEMLLLGRALAAVQCVGSMSRALEMTVAYACVREQFGKPIGSFQAVRHHAANMAMQVASSRSLAFEALFALDSGWESAAELIATAKASASRAAPWVLMLGHQIHGGNGVIEENDLYFFTLRGKDRSLAWGTADECLEVLAESAGSPAEFL